MNSSAGDLVLVVDTSWVRVVTLNRADQLNAFNQALCAALTRELTLAAADEAVHVMVVTGAGRAFSAGTDLLELWENGDFRGTPEDPDLFDGLIDALVGFPKPLICAVNGLAIGIGATMLGLADLVICGQTVRLRCPFTKLSLVPEAGASVTFPLLLGRQAAAWMLLSSEWIDADEAKSNGLVWKVVPDDDVLEEALVIAQGLAQHPLESLVASKRLLTAPFSTALAEARTRENAAFDVLLNAPAHREAVAAFASKREPSTSGGPSD